MTFQPVPEEKSGKTRVHLDVWVDDLDAAFSLVAQLDGSDTGDRHDYEDGTVVVMADPEGNEFCLVGGPRQQTWHRQERQISSRDLGVRRIMTEAATRRAAPTTVNTKCNQLQLNCRWTATAAWVEQAV